jgi:hypothetical protein
MQAERLRKSLEKNLSDKLVYKPSLKGKVAGLPLKTEVPNVPEAVAAALVGAGWPSKPGKGQSIKPKTPLALDIRGKTLRYGAGLSVSEDGMKVTWEREGQVLKVSGRYTMM